MQNICKTYEKYGVKALDDVSLYVEKGGFCAVVGTSGSGKTTLMNIAGCLDVPSTGSYFFDNTAICEKNRDKLERIRNTKIGFIFQNFNLIHGMTALQNVTLPLMLSGVKPRIRQELGMEALRAVDLEMRASHRPRELSGGQQQRVAVARAIIQKPVLILADEPTGNLDKPSGKYVLDLIMKLNEAGSTVLMITHDENVAKMARQVVRIEEGRIKK